MNIPYFHLKFEEHNKCIDYGPNKLSVVSYNGSLPAEGKASKYSAYFNGDASKYIRCGLGKTLNPATTAVTWSMWVMKNAHTVESYPIFASFGLPYLACNSNTSPFRLSYRANAAQLSLNGTTIPALNTWYHLAATFSSSGTKLYVNGVLEASAANVQDAFDSTSFDIGRHYDTDVYRIWGRIDDVRIFEKELTLAEIGLLYNPQSDPTKMSFKDNGDIVCYGISEDVEWTVLDNFQSSLDGGIKKVETAIGGNNITSTATLTAAGWTQSLTNIETTSYTRLKGYLQMYYSGTPVGYIYKSLPAGYDRVKIYWGNWYDGGTATLKIGGTAVQTLAANFGGSIYVGNYSGTPEIRFEESGIFWVSQIWVGKSKTQSASITNTAIQKHTFVHAGLSPNLHDYSNWAVGTGSSGSFVCNGLDSENYRGIMADPWGQHAILWECRASGDSAGDGGWNYSIIPIDNTKRYRYSVWVKKNSNVAGNGTFYHGINGYGTTNGVYGRTDGALNTNPYFYASDTGLAPGTWYLIVGHVWPTGSGTGTIHTDSGIYTMSGAKSAITQDYVWHPSSVTGRGRTYLYYSTVATARQWLVYPMFEECDGTEAPIRDLINGRAYVNSGRVPGTIYDLGTAKQQINDNKLFIKGKIILK